MQARRLRYLARQSKRPLGDSSPVTISSPTVSARSLSLAPPSRLADRAFHGLTLAAALAVALLFVLVTWLLYRGAHLSIAKFGCRCRGVRMMFPRSPPYGDVAARFGEKKFCSSTLPTLS